MHSEDWFDNQFRFATHIKHVVCHAIQFVLWCNNSIMGIENHVFSS